MTVLLGATLSIAQEAGSPRLQSIEAAIQEASFSARPVPVTVRGIVISTRHLFVIEDRTGATEVKPLETEPIALGDEVEVIGQMTVSSNPEVQQGRLRRLWGGSMPLPLSITPDQAAGGENDLLLVQTAAELVNFAPAGLTGVRLNLRGGHQNFSAVLPSDSAGGELPSKFLRPGAKLRLTGVLVLNHALDPGHGEAFSIELRSMDDLELEESPSWWTRIHLLMASAVAAILILIGISGYYRVKHSRYRAVAEERASIARDIHDTVAQGYAGIALQLEAAQQTIKTDPGRAAGLLAEALQLVRHSRDESHLSIDILRSLARNDRLDVLISHCVMQLQASGANIEQQITGEPIALSYTLVNNLFRIAQEALTNAIGHAQANRVVVRVGYGRRVVTIEVEDDGKGFDPAAAAGPNEGHYGLLGMRERCAAINGTLELESSGAGTRIRVQVRG
jgi:signal transduction histidine kinase